MRKRVTFVVRFAPHNSRNTKNVTIGGLIIIVLP